MHGSLKLLLVLWCVFTMLHRASAAVPFEWESATPESQGMSSAKLDALMDVLAARSTRALLVVRSNKIVYERYSVDQTALTKQGTASLAKALVAGMSLAVALSDRKIGLDDPVSKFVPQWRDDPRKAKITIRQLGSHTSGLEDAEADRLPHEKLTGWKGDFWKRLDPPHDPFTTARDIPPVLFEPGERLQYSNPGIGMLTYVVTAAIKSSPQQDIRTLLRDRILRPLGVLDAEWSVGYGQTFQVDGLPLVAAWGGGAFTPRATARIGRLVLREGDWDGQQLLTAQAVREVTGDAGLPGHCGMGWWTNASGRYEAIPRDAVWGAGAGDQLLFVVPSLRLIMVRNGQSLGTESDTGDVFARYHDGRAKLLFEPLIQAITDRQAVAAPPPASPVIRSVTWAPTDTIVRAAKGSDNWPLTWGADDQLYGAYGDGNGFEPFVKQKLSLGLAHISGGPNDFRGINLRSADIEQHGDGPQGKKASGLLMVGGVLYLWVRNSGNSQLAWSEDRGQTWSRADWKWTTGFGAPTFLNFGRNYAGARDESVYVFSSDSDSAYEPADRMVLARVPQGRLRDRQAYEFFVALNEDGQPKWTKSLADRGAVFTHPGRCYRSGITYNAALRRYLWCQILRESTDPRGPRFQGGFGIYDAPEPWGPWTTAFFTKAWDVGPGDTSSFPTKWMSADGRTLHLVFSGDDCFSVRRATLQLAD